MIGGMNRLGGILFVFACLLVLAFRGPAPVLPTAPAAAKKINWLSIEQAYALAQKEPRKFVIDVYTDWCGWCKVMDRETFSRPAIVDYVNEHYYPVRFNAEQTATVKLGKQTFRFVGSGRGGVHELAAALLNNKLSYPSTVFMDEKFEMIQPIAGYLEPRTFHQIITFFGSNTYRQQSFDQFKATTYPQRFETSVSPARPQ